MLPVFECTKTYGYDCLSYVVIGCYLSGRVRFQSIIGDDKSVYIFSRLLRDVFYHYLGRLQF